MSKSKTFTDNVYDWIVGGQNCIAICYINNGTNFVLRGRRDLVFSHVENLGVTTPMVVHFVAYGMDADTVPKICVYGLRKGFNVEFIFCSRWNPGTGEKEKHCRNWIVVKKVVKNAFPGMIVYAKRVRQFHRGWIKELDPFVIGSKNTISPMEHDGNIKPSIPKINHVKGAFNKIIPNNKIPIDSKEINKYIDSKEINKKYDVGNRMRDDFELLQDEIRKKEAARIKAELDAENARIGQHRIKMLRHLRKVGVLSSKGHKEHILEIA